MKILKIKSTWFADSDLRLDAEYHLSEGVIAKSQMKKSPYPLSTLGAECRRLFSGNIFKRTYVSNQEFGYPYLTGSDMVKSNIDSGKFLSKKHTEKVDNLRIHKDWILISCSGTLGNTVFTNDDFEGRIGTHDLIRAIPNENNTQKGFLYAYLSSKFGYALLTQSSYGGVVKHIEPHHIKDLPIPLFPKEKQTAIHDLIVAAAELRVAANELLRGAQEIIMLEVGIKEKINSNKISIREIVGSHQQRFESQYFISEGHHIKEQIKKQPFEYLKDITESIFRPGIFKRHYVAHGVEFLGGSDIVKAIPQSEKKLSIHRTQHLNSLLVKEDWILVTCGGTIGYSVLVDRFLAEKAASQHILRVISKNIQTGYLFAFLSSPLGLKAIQSFTYGSVIPQIEPHHLGLLPIPILENTIMDKVHDMIMQYKNNTAEAIEKEQTAITLIEQTIDAWQ